MHVYYESLKFCPGCFITMALWHALTSVWAQLLNFLALPLFLNPLTNQPPFLTEGF